MSIGEIQTGLQKRALMKIAHTIKSIKTDTPLRNGYGLETAIFPSAICAAI